MEEIMKKILLFTLVFVFVLGTFNAFAQRGTSFEITPFAGYRLGGSFDVEGLDYANFDFKDGFTYGISLGFSVHENLQVEAMWSREETTLRGRLIAGPRDDLFKIFIDQYHLNFLYIYGDDSMKMRPFVLAGLGLTYFNPKPDISGETRFSFALGTGLKFYMGEHFGLRLQVKWVPTYINTKSAVFYDYWLGPFVVPVTQYMGQWEFTGGIIFRF